MSSEHTDQSNRIDRDLLEASPSTGWAETYEILNAPPQMDPDRLAAMNREDRTERYRRKHRHGVSS
ncbi:hypothetical protein [Haloarcula amylolytica]|uniref:hypothetical protein n=1 Tax=Haloarcula amylolytica TaxID=396317 RepID=UPI003C76B85A